MLDARNNKLVFICKASINTVRINTLVWSVATLVRCSYLINGKVHEINWNCLFSFFSPYSLLMLLLLLMLCRFSLFHMHEAVALYLSGCLNPLWKCGRLPLYLVIKCMILLEFLAIRNIQFSSVTVFMAFTFLFLFCPVLLLDKCEHTFILLPTRFVSHASQSTVEWLQSLSRKHVSGSRHNPHGRK